MSRQHCSGTVRGSRQYSLWPVSRFCGCHLIAGCIQQAHRESASTLMSSTLPSSCSLPMSQVIDRLCASAHYRQAVSCEDTGTSMAASPNADCLVRLTMSRNRVVHLPVAPPQPSSPTAMPHPQGMQSCVCDDQGAPLAGPSFSSTSVPNLCQYVKNPLVQAVAKTLFGSLLLLAACCPKDCQSR